MSADPPNDEEEPVAAKPEPSVGTLLLANLKVLLGVAAFAVLAFLAWKGLASLFPEVAWLQGPRG